MIIDFNGNTNIDLKDKAEITSILFEAFWNKMKWYFSKMNQVDARILFGEAITYNMGYYYKEDGKVLGAALLSKRKTPYLKINRHIRKKMGFIKGMLFGKIFNVTSPKKHVICLQMISVSPNARGKGVGKKMLDYMNEIAKNNGSNQIILDVIDNNKGAIKLYEREGYTISKHVNTKLFTHGMGFDGIYVMKKDIDLTDIIIR